MEVPENQSEMTADEKVEWIEINLEEQNEWRTGLRGDVSVEGIGIGVTRLLENGREEEKRPKKDVAGFFSGGKKFKIALWRQEDK